MSNTPDEVKPEGNDKEILNHAMALCRTGWQMACDELLSYCNDKKVSPQFIDQIFSMMDEKKKHQFSWEKFNEELKQMGLLPAPPKQAIEKM